MANKKIGLDFYRTDTDRYQDKRIKRLRKELGTSGVAIYDYILCEIYRDNGCFIGWDADTAFDVAEYWGVKESLVIEVVNYCCHVGLFHKGLLVNENVLSSKSIQDRYLEMCRKAKRTDASIPEEYKIIQEERAIIPEECADNSSSLPHSIVKESIVKERKEKNKGTAADAASYTDDQKTKFKGLEVWIKANAPTVGQMKEPLSIDQFIALKERFTTDQLADILIKMHNWEPLKKKNRSTYLTILNWMKKDFNTPSTSPVTAPTSSAVTNKMLDMLKTRTNGITE